jgi:hypothetical protein
MTHISVDITLPGEPTSEEIESYADKLDDFIAEVLPVGTQWSSVFGKDEDA